MTQGVFILFIIIMTGAAFLGPVSVKSDQIVTSQYRVTPGYENGRVILTKDIGRSCRESRTSTQGVFPKGSVQ